MTLDEVLPPEAVRVFLAPLQPNAYEVTLGMFLGKEERPKKGPEDQDRPWSDTHQWSFLILDEGGPSPYASHITFEWSMQPHSFIGARQKTPLPVDALNGPKLDHLLRRYAGQLKDPPLLADGRPANRLNFPGLEKRDVLTGLLDYAALGEEYAERLNALYVDAGFQPFGPGLDLDTLRKELNGLVPAADPS